MSDDIIEKEEDVLEGFEDPKPKKKRKKRSKKTDQFYVNPNEFREEIATFYVTEKCTHNLGNMINKIADGLSFRSNFINYSYKDEMVGDAKLKMYSALVNKKFDVTSTYNPFAYFTTIAFHAFINRIKKEKRQHETVTRYKEKIYDELLNEGEGGHIYTRPVEDEEEY